MNKRIVKRVLEESQYMIDTGKTIREIAAIFGVSKSTVHKDLNDRLKGINQKMYNKVSSILRYHIDIRHIRGGESTKQKFLEKNALL